MTLPHESTSRISIFSEVGIKKFGRAINNLFEGKSLLQLFLSLLAALVWCVGFFADSISLWTKWSTVFLKSLSAVGFVLLLSFSIYQFFLLRKRIADLDFSKMQTRYANKLIKRAVDSSPSNYKVVLSEIIFDIQPNGDAKFSRKMKLEGVNTHIPWAYFNVGVIGGDDFSMQDMHIRIVDPDDHSELAFSIIEDFTTQKKIAVLLDPPAGPNKAASFFATMDISRAFLDLIARKPDDGNISIKNETEDFLLRIIAPQNYVLSHFRWTIVPPGEKTVTTQDDGRSVLEWRGSKIPMGEYKYQLII